MRHTAEYLTVTTLGTKEQGHQSEGPLDRRTGLGWVAATAKHDYADAQRKGNYVLLLITENSGAMHRHLVRGLHGLALQSRLATSEDSIRSSRVARGPAHVRGTRRQRLVRRCSSSAAATAAES